MAARKKSATKNPVTNAGSQASSTERTRESQRDARTSPSRTSEETKRPPARGGAANLGRDPKESEFRAATTGVAAGPDGIVMDANVQTKSPQSGKVQVSNEELALKVDKTGAAVVAESKANEASGHPASKATLAPGAKPKPATKDDATAAPKSGKGPAQKQGFKLNEFVVYPAHGVGQIVSIEEQEVAGFKLELFVISFSKDKMTLRVPTAKVAGVGMRKISDPETAKRSLEVLSGRARIKRTMWSRRAQEYETKINSGDITAIAEVVRDLYRSDAQPEQSYSERQLYEAALDRMVREIAAVQKANEIDALKAIEAQLQKGQSRQAKASAGAETTDAEIEEAA